MRFLNSVLIFLIISNSINAQKYIDFNYSRDYKKILELTKMDTSELFYPKLYKRFISLDSTLTNYEVLAMQIGYTDNENYWPYEDIEIEMKIWELNEQGEFEKAIRTCDTLLDRNPFSILASREKSYAFHKLNQKDSADYYWDRFIKIVRCDLLTGDGRTYKTSRFVISPIDGQWIIRFLLKTEICYMGSGYDKNENFHDILGYQLSNESQRTKKRKKENECIKLYFNIQHAAIRMFGKESMKQIEELLKKD